MRRSVATREAPPVLLKKLRELELDTPSQSGRPAFVSAASGLVRVGPRFYVVADDELQLGVFPVTGAAAGSLVRLLPGELPLPKAERKKRKPDFEAIARLPVFSRYPQGALLALGSGSKHRRCRLALLPLTNDAADARSVRVLDADRLFEAAAQEVDDLNVEGAFVRDGQLVLMHRGNARHPACALLSFALEPLLRSIEDDDELGKVRLEATRSYELGRIDEVPLTFTDGAVLDDGTVVFCAVAEQTDDSYTDGPCRGAALGTIAADGRLQRIELLDARYKVEGIHAERAADPVCVWLVSDADDAAVPAALLYGELR